MGAIIKIDNLRINDRAKNFTKSSRELISRLQNIGVVNYSEIMILLPCGQIWKLYTLLIFSSLWFFFPWKILCMSLEFGALQNRLFVNNAGSGFRMLWNAIKSFLDPKTAAKVHESIYKCTLKKKILCKPYFWECYVVRVGYSPALLQVEDSLVGHTWNTLSVSSGLWPNQTIKYFFIFN